jgi:hypothetical protein
VFTITYPPGLTASMANLMGSISLSSNITATWGVFTGSWSSMGFLSMVRNALTGAPLLSAPNSGFAMA